MSPVVANPIWTPYEDERLRALAFSGASAATIAEQIKRTEAAVRKRAARLNIVVAKSRLKAKGNDEGPGGWLKT